MTLRPGSRRWPSETGRPSLLQRLRLEYRVVSSQLLGGEDAAEAVEANLEELAADQILRLIEARIKGHGLASLVEAILQAEGYTTYRSSEGADGGVDILAGGGELGFGKPQICVEVKSGSEPVDRPTVDKLIGAGQKFGAETCLFVSWGGFG